MKVTKKSTIVMELDQDEAEKLSAAMFAIDWNDGEGPFYEEVYDALSDVGIHDFGYGTDDEEVTITRELEVEIEDDGALS